MPTALTQTTSANWTGSFSDSIPGKIVFAVAATLVVAAAAHISVPLPFTPVPLTLQPLAVLGVGLALGPWTAFASLVLYLLEGASGLSVFSPTGPGGFLQLLGPTGGYLLAYPLVAFLSSSLTCFASNKLPRFASALIGCSVATVVLFACGAAWLMHFGQLSWQHVWIAAVVPFLPGEIVKVLAASGIYNALTRQTQR